MTIRKEGSPSLQPDNSLRPKGEKEEDGVASIVCIENARIYTPDVITGLGYLTIQSGIIVETGTGPPPKLPLAKHREDEHNVKRIDVHGRIVVPGFIDLQVNGAYGHDFSAEPECMWEVASRMHSFGVTAFLPTFPSTPHDIINRVVEVLKDRPADYRGSEPLGLHLEGPYINPEKKGAHNIHHIEVPPKDPPPSWTGKNGIKLVTLAPELPNGMDLIRTLRGRGVVVSGGHSLADFSTTKTAIDAGLRYGTHLFNAMPPLSHRNPAMPGALLDDPRVAVGVIVDGEHLHPSMVRLAWSRLGPKRMSLVSDGMAAMGVPPGKYKLGTTPVLTDGSSARLLDGTLAGSVVPLDACVRNLIAYTGCSLQDALATVTAVPAEVLGIQRGRLLPGYPGDFVVLNDDLHVNSTWIGGEQMPLFAPFSITSTTSSLSPSATFSPTSVQDIRSHDHHHPCQEQKHRDPSQVSPISLHRCRDENNEAARKINRGRLP